jgi:Tfp pilus assembly protein PilF
MTRNPIYYLLAALLIGSSMTCSRPQPTAPPADAGAAKAEPQGDAETGLDPIGLRLLEAGKNEEAAAYFRQRLEQDPQDLAAREGLAVAICRRGQSREALEEFTRVITADARRASAYFSRGLCLEGLGRERSAEAEADFHSVIALRPEDAPAHNQLGLIFQTRGNHPAAIAEFKTALALDPKNFLVHNNLGASLLATGRYDEAIAVLQQALALNPDPKGVSVYNNLGLALLRASRYGQAEAAFLMETAINPRNLDAHLNLGNLYALSQRSGEAALEYQRVLLTNPQHQQALVNLGALYVNSGNYGAGFGILAFAESLYPNNALVHHYLGIIYQAQGDTGRAQTENDSARELGYRPGMSPWPDPAAGGTAP